MTLTDVLVDFAQLSVLMIVAAWLRRKIYALQRFYIPAALLAGILAILCGPQVLGQVSPIHMEFTTLGQWSGVLSAIVFSCSFLGLKLNKVGAGAMQTYFLGGTIHQLQIAVGLTLTFLLGLFIQDLPLGFGLLPVMGYYGGHSMAIAVGTTFVENGYMESGIELGTTFATVGLLCGVIWGMIIINRAAKSGKTSIKMKIEDLPKDMLTGYYEPGHRPSLGNSVTSSATLDPLGAQLMMVGLIIMGGYLLRTGLMAINPFFSNLPLFACCLIFSAVFCICTQKSAKINDMIDRPTVVRISGTALEYLIVSALATTNLGVFVTYAVPLIVVCIGVSIVTYWACFILGKRVLPKNGQFETGIGLFGQCCGVLATGLLLLKIVDPDYKTNAATNITSSSTLGYTYQLQYTLIFATLIMTSPLFTYIWSWLLLAVLLGCGLFFGRRIHARGE